MRIHSYESPNAKACIKVHNTRKYPYSFPKEGPRRVLLYVYTDGLTTFCRFQLTRTVIVAWNPPHLNSTTIVSLMS